MKKGGRECRIESGNPSTFFERRKQGAWRGRVGCALLERERRGGDVGFDNEILIYLCLSVKAREAVLAADCGIILVFA